MEKESSIPKLLQEIPDPPKKLYKIGNFPSQDEYIFLCIVGSRKHSPYGKQVCESLIAGLAGYPFVIVSGLALGMDAIAHQSALRHNIKTIAIPGSGLEKSVLYPAAHRKLAEDIVTSGGCLLSEFEPKTKAAPWTFPQRNRLMAGMSHATLVIEAENKSGTRITARLATDYNREVFAVPGSIFSTASEGTNTLIKEGATPVTSPSDILEYFGLHKSGHTKQETLPLLEKDEESLLNLVRNSPRSRNELSRELEMSITQVSILVSKMEIKGYLKEELGKIYPRL